MPVADGPTSTIKCELEEQMAEDVGIDLTKRLPRGAIPSPRHELAAATPHVPDATIMLPPSFLMWPAQMSSWNNYTYGDCVTAEEAFAKATAAPQTFISEATVVAWASAHGYINGASLTSVLSTMQSNGFPLNNRTYDDGRYYSVNWTDAGILNSAIYSHGPVKIGVGADDFQSNANGLVTPGASGWAMYNYPRNLTEDHCVSLCGYGTLAELVSLFKQHNVAVNVPNGMPTGLCYAMFTWNSIGIIDQQSMLNMTYEAWIRNPVTLIVSQNQIGNNTTSSTPFVTPDGWVWFQGTDDKLWKVHPDGSQQSQPRDNATSSAPFVVGGWVYFRGTDNKLWRMATDGSSQNVVNNNTTSSTPYVTPDGWVWFQGTDNSLWKVHSDGTQQTKPGNNTTSSSPFVLGEWVYFRGTDNKLWRMKTDGSSQNVINNNTSSSTPFVTPDGWVWFQGTDNRLWKVHTDGSQQSQPGNNTTSSPPFVLGQWVYFRGTDNKLWRMKTDGSAQNVINNNTTSSSPFVTDDGWVYFRGTDNKLWRCLESD
jgi:hypothetical protein